jgi:hypothetical protein
MSVVISFRLNPDNPREAQALEILRTKQAEGFSSRLVITDALISMVTPKRQYTIPFSELNATLEQVSGLLEELNSSNKTLSQPTRTQVVALSDRFLNSVKVAAKPGLKKDPKKELNDLNL